MEHLQYPIGRFSPQDDYSAQEITGLIGLLETLPTRYAKLLDELSDDELTRTYREGSWTVKQLAHHVADIHLVNFLRIKKTLTETDYVATIVQMNEWNLTPDATAAPVEDSLLMMEGISRRLAFLFKNLSESDLSRSFYHPTRQLHLTIKQTLHMAVWHMAHHQGHIQLALGLTPQPFRMA